MRGVSLTARECNKVRLVCNRFACLGSKFKVQGSKFQRNEMGRAFSATNAPWTLGRRQAVLSALQGLKKDIHKGQRMKRARSVGLVLALAMTLLTGCSWSVGSSPKTSNVMPTTGQQLMDLQKARNAGAISDAEYQAQRTKLLGNP
jgi:hypothetical protein